MGDPELQATVASLPSARVSFTPAGSFERAQRFLDEIDIGIAPLAPTAYNSCRDDLRFLEYAAHGVLAVCADLEPFREVVRPGQTGFLFRDTAELETVLERALAEAEAARGHHGPRGARRRRAVGTDARRAPAGILSVRRRADGDPPRWGRWASGVSTARAGQLLPRRRSCFPDSRYLALGAGKDRTAAQ